MKCKNEICENELSGYQRKFCSSSCAATVNNRGVRRHGSSPKKCLNCDNPVKKNALKFCSNECYNDHKFKTYIEKWLNGEISGNHIRRGDTPSPIRKYLFQKNNNSCSKCGWDKVNPYTKSNLPILEIEHIDGDCENNRPENLDLLCRNCHSLTPTFGSLNEHGNGRRAKGLL